MSDTMLNSRILRFGTFELDLAAGELRKSGRKVRVQEQPFQLLVALVEKPGEVVTREELKDKLWPGDTYVDFDRSLNTAASKLRDALGDSASSPRFIETLPRRGYRFLASVESVGGPAAGLEGVSGVAADAPRDGRESTSHEFEQRQRLLRLALAVTAAVAIVVMGLLVFQWLDEPSATDAMALRKFSFTPPERLSQPEPWFASHVAVSPNGKHVAFIAGDRQTLWVRDLANEQVREIPGTENALFPFWSPDSEFIGFGTDKELKKISVEGAAAITLSELPGEWYFGGSWSPDGDSIVFASNSPEQFYEVLAGGGSPELFFDLEESEGGTQVLNPEFLPSEAAARSVVFAEGSRSGMEVVLKNLETGERLSLGTGAFPRYSSTGHIVYQTNYREGGLWALPFSIRTLQPTGEAFPIAQNAGFPSIADDGTLVYVDFGAGGGERQLVWMNREGGKLGTVGQPQASIRHTDLSPDETRVAVTAGDEEGHNEIWVHEVERGVKTRITFTSGGQAMSPHWSPSGSELLFSSAREGSQTLDIHVKSADGTGEAKLVFGSELNDYASDWSTDGRYALADQHSPTTQFPTHVLLLGRKDDGRFEGSPLFATEYVEKAAKLSPDGRYVAYVSDESGVFELYVQRFPDGGEKLQISVRGGRQPRWSRDGAELFFVEDDALMVVQVEHGERLSVSAPEMLFRSAAFGTSPHAHYDVSSDGRRFILAEYTDRNPTRIRVVQNWYEEFKDQERD